MTCSNDAILDMTCADQSLLENHDLQACCTPRRIAREGGGKFASVGSAADLRTAMKRHHLRELEAVEPHPAGDRRSRRAE